MCVLVAASSILQTRRFKVDRSIDCSYNAACILHTIRRKRPTLEMKKPLPDKDTSCNCNQAIVSIISCPRYIPKFRVVLVVMDWAGLTYRVTHLAGKNLSSI